MPWYRWALILLGIGAVVTANLLQMDTGAWIALGALVVTAGQLVAEGVRKRRSERIADLEARVKELAEAQARCDARLSSAYAWIEWARQNMVLRPDAAPGPLSSLCQ